MEEPVTRVSFEEAPRADGGVSSTKPVSDKVEPRARQMVQAAPPELQSRKTSDGRPSNGDPLDFENSFSITDETTGLRYDFRDGLRVMVPVSFEGEFELTAMDNSTGFVHHKVRLRPGDSFSSRKKWFIPWRFTLSKNGDTLVDHVMNLDGREVAIHYPRAGIGDTIAWFSYAYSFYGKTGCNLTVCMEKRMRRLFENAYSDFKWADEDAWRNTPFYAVYHMGIFSPDNENDRQPEDFRLHGLHHAAARILGLRECEGRPLLDWDDKAELPPSPYVCIATRASSRCKEWLNPYGWPTVVKWLKDRGYNVVAIDKEDTFIPNGSVDMTGDVDLLQRVVVLKNAKAFVGVSSGMSWLAWACGTPVVLVSGFTLPHNEFKTPYRVINEAVCHGCWNDMREDFDHFDTNYCPRHRDTPRQHECSYGITPEQVIKALSRALEDNE